jgi:hypothetical protein
LTAPDRSEKRFLIRGKGSLRTANQAGYHSAAILVPFFSATDIPGQNTAGALALDESAGRIPSIDSGASGAPGGIVSERKNFLA